MTTTTILPEAGPRPGTRRRTRSRWRRHWYRMVIPFAVFALLVGVTWVARHLEEPNLGDPATLAPAGTGPDGSSRLAGLLAARGVAITHVGDIQQALDALDAGGGAVVFVPKPTTFGAAFATIAAHHPAGHRVVLVAPSTFQLGVTGLPVAPGRSRWATRAAAPGCAVPEAEAAGRAAVLHHRYAVADPDQVCYRGGLVRTRATGSEVFVVGASDPFRNRRIDEHGNARLAVELLAARDRVIWADALPFEADLQPQLSELGQPERPEPDRTSGSAFGDLFDGYPTVVLVGLALAAVLALLVALALARRLGGPVSEPLPVPVPAAEAVAGRGRLYQRTHGRGVALATLRTAALRRIVRALGLPSAPPPEPGTVVDAVVGRTGLPADQVRRTLYGPEPETDQELANAVAALDALVDAVTREPRRDRKEQP